MFYSPRVLAREGSLDLETVSFSVMKTLLDQDSGASCAALVAWEAINHIANFTNIVNEGYNKVVAMSLVPHASTSYGFEYWCSINLALSTIARPSRYLRSSSLS